MYSAPNLTSLARVLPQPHGLLRVAVAGRDRKGLEIFDDILLVDDLESCDVVLCDAAVRSPLAPPPEAPLVVLLNDGADALEAIAGGARGAISRSSSPSRIHAALRAVGEGLIVIDREPSRDVDPLTDPLTAREQDVLRLLSSGLTNKEIATRLGITDHTVKFHVNAILGKLGAETRTEAVVHAAKLGIVVL
jgi:two-component system, NarL family, nitrate/nitrite response regulator NarL